MSWRQRFPDDVNIVRILCAWPVIHASSQSSPTFPRCCFFEVMFLRPPESSYSRFPERGMLNRVPPGFFICLPTLPELSGSLE